MNRPTDKPDVAINTDSSVQAKPSCLDRREFITVATKVSAALAADLTLGDFSAASESEAFHASTSELVTMDALALSQTIKAKQVSCKEVMAAFLEHIERMNPKVNAIVSLQPRDALMKQAAERDSQLTRGEYLGWMHGLVSRMQSKIWHPRREFELLRARPFGTRSRNRMQSSWSD